MLLLALSKSFHLVLPPEAGDFGIGFDLTLHMLMLHHPVVASNGGADMTLGLSLFPTRTVLFTQ